MEAAWRRRVTGLGRLKGSVRASVFAALAGVAVGAVERVTQGVESVATEANKELVAVVSLRGALSDISVFVHDSILGDPDGRARFNRTAAALDDIFDDMRGVTFHDPSEVRLLREAEGAWRRTREAGRALIDRPSGGSDAEAKGLSERFHREVSGALALVRGMEGSAREEIAKEVAASSANRAETLRLVGSALAVALLALVLTERLLKRRVLDPLGSLTLGVERVSAGDFSCRVEVGGDSEYARLGEAFNAMVTGVCELTASLSEIALRDPLTDLWNRRVFDDRLREEVDRARRTGRSVALVLLDVDRFKQINDAFGHPAGDEVLRSVAAGVCAASRRSDVVARVGGDEIAVLLPETSAAQAAIVADRIRAAIGRRCRGSEGVPIRVAVSGGVAAMPEDAGASDALIAAADGALYTAKREGGDCVVRAESRGVELTYESGAVERFYIRAKPQPALPVAQPSGRQVRAPGAASTSEPPYGSGR